MKILAIESSAKAASAAICEDTKIIAQYYQASGLTHSRTLLPMVQDMLKGTGLKMEDIDGIAVAAGPGSFTGIRIGVAAAKGLAWGADKPLCGVSTLAAMAHVCGETGVIICPVMDARRSQVYNALFENRDGILCRLTPDRAISLEALLSEAGSFEKPFFFIGDGAVLSYDYFSQNGVYARIAGENIRLQSAWGVAVESLSGKFCDPGELTPNYLRLSQAERERLEKLKTEK